MNELFGHPNTLYRTLFKVILTRLFGFGCISLAAYQPVKHRQDWLGDRWMTAWQYK